MFYVINLVTGGMMNPYAVSYSSRTVEQRAKNDKEFSGYQEETEARDFAEFCAKKYKGTEFGVTKLIARVQTVDPPVKWVDAS